MSYSLDNPTALEQRASAYKNLYNFKLFASLYTLHTLHTPIRQIVGGWSSFFIYL